MAIVDYKYIPFFNLIGGINTVSSAIGLSPDECRDSQDVIYRPIGGFTKRKGYDALNDTEQNSGAGVTGLFMARYTSTNVALFVIGDKLYSMPASLNGTFTDRTNSLTITDNDNTPWSFAQLNNIVVLGNGSDNSIQINASLTATALTGAGTNMTKFKFPLEIRGYMFYFYPTVSGTAYPDRCYFSDINDPATTGTNNFLNIAVGHGGEIGGAVEYKTYLFVFKRHGIYQVIYQPTRVNSSGTLFPWAEVPNPVVSGVGTQSHRSIVKFTTPVTHATPGQELVFFVDQFGVPRIFDGRTTISFASKIGTSRDTRIKSLDDMDRSRTQYAHAVNYPEQNMILFWLSESSTQSDVTWVFDYSKGFSIGRFKYYLPFNCSALFEKPNGTFKPYVGDYAGKAYELDTGTTDDGQDINDYYVTGDTPLTHPFIENKWFLLDLRGKTGSSSQKVRVSYYVNGEDTATKTEEIPLASDQTQWGAFVWGQAQWAVAEGMKDESLEIAQVSKTLRVKVESVDKGSDSLIIEGFAMAGKVEGTTQV